MHQAIWKDQRVLTAIPSSCRQEKESLEQAMRENEATENEMKRLQQEKGRREEAERCVSSL